MSCPFCKSKDARPRTTKEMVKSKRFPGETMYCPRCYAKYDPEVYAELKAEILREMARLRKKYAKHDVLCIKILNRMEWIL